jgi:hypothetical protein
VQRWLLDERWLRKTDADIRRERSIVGRVDRPAASYLEEGSHSDERFQ